MINRPFIFDTDGGVDDAQALLLLLAHNCAPDIVTTVFGNVSLEQATENMLATLAIAGADIPVHSGADRPLVQPIIDARHVHGEDGLGGAPRPSSTGLPASGDAVSVLVDVFSTAARRGHRADILLIGPLTNLALALRRDPTIVDGIGRVTIMGGTVYGRGNTTPAAEFNIFADPEAAQIVFSTPLDMTVVPWEPCVNHAMTGAEVEEALARQPANATRDFSLALARHLRRAVKTWTGADMLRIVDPFAAAVIVDPTIILSTVSASIQVSLAPGLTRGMTIVDPFGRLGTPAFTIVEQASMKRLHELYVTSTAYQSTTAMESTP